MAHDTLASAGPDAATIRCHARVVSLNGQSILRLPESASALLPSRGQVAVTGALEGELFQTVVEPDGRRGHWIRLDDRLPMPGRIVVGQDVALTLAPADEWPEPVVPADLQAALEGASDIADMWTSITPMARWEWVRWIQATRNPGTRARRVENAVSKMRSGKRRPCCFNLSACTDPELGKNGKLIDAGPDG